MKLARYLTFAGILLSAGALAVGYVPAGAVEWYVVAGLVALLWLAAEWRGWGWATWVSFVLVTVLAAVGLFTSTGALWMAVAVTLGATAWALGGYVRRVAAQPHVDDPDVRARRLLVRLLALDLVSLALAAVALRIDVELPFVVALLLGALLVYGLSRVIGTLQRESV